MAWRAFQRSYPTSGVPNGLKEQCRLAGCNRYSSHDLITAQGGADAINPGGDWTRLVPITFLVCDELRHLDCKTSELSKAIDTA